MLVTIFSFLLFLVFLVLSGFHFYWLFGGRWGTDRVFPSKNDELNAHQIPKMATLMVAIGLAAFGLLYLQKSGFIQFDIPVWIHQYAYWVIPIIFIIRAIGEFNYVGLFKKVKHTKFAKADTKLFSPLCLGIGIIGLLIQLMN